MFTRSIAPLLSLAIFAYASPFPVTRQTEPTAGDWCAGLGGDIIDLNLANFTLAAWNPNGNNVNDTGNPLVLSATGTTGGFSTHILAVSAPETRVGTES